MPKQFQKSVHLGFDSEGKRILKTVRADTKKDLERKVLEIKGRRLSGRDYVSKSTFDDWAKKWFYEQKVPQNLSKSALAVIEHSIAHLNRYFADMSIRDINLSMFQSMINDYAFNNPTTDRPMSTDYLKKLKSTAQSIFEYAEANNVADVPRFFKAVIIPKKTDSNSFGRRALTEEEQRYILDTPHRRQLPSMIMLFSGLRRGECLALEWSDIDLVENVIYVDKSLEFGKNQGTVKRGGKTASATRTVPIPPVLSAYLRDYRNSLSVISKYVCTTSTGQLHTKTSWRRLWDSYLLDLNLKYGYSRDLKKNDPHLKVSELPMRIERFTPHYLRYTFATLLYLQNVNIYDAMQILGHSDVSTTVNIYTDFRSLNKSKLSDTYKKRLQSDFRLNVI